MEKENQFFTTYAKTEAWLNDMGIKNYTIHDDLTVDVDKNVFLHDKNLDCIPIQFQKISGGFYCYNNNLQSLKGSPSVVEGNFNCQGNQLKNLQYIPQKISGNVYCYKNKITSLKDISIEVSGFLSCVSNPISDFSHLKLNIKKEIIFTLVEGMEYLDNYKNSVGEIFINFDLFKKIQKFKPLYDKLNNDLIVNSNVIKKMKV